MRGYTRFLNLFRLSILVSLLTGSQSDILAQSSAIPELITPVYQNIKNLHSDISLVTAGKPVSVIVSPKQYITAASIIQAAIEKRTGVRISVVADTDAQAVTPFIQNLIILGNRSTSKISNELYDRYYSLMDLKYPGPRGYAVRSLHNPYGNGFSAVLVGGSDAEGVLSGARAFAASLPGLPASQGNLSVGWTILTRLGDGVKIPTNPKEFETWETNKGYGSVGYFGWNSISKRMAMYYMTGDPFHAREALRLSFPDAQALKEIDEIDGELIENKKDPLAGPYHYGAMMQILYWDLIEESPVFNDADRLKVTNAFARRFTHEGTPPFDKQTYQLNTVPKSVGSRHDQWSAMSVYTLARYFNKYYPSPMWAHAERAGKLHFASLHNTAWVVGEGDQLNWYGTAIAPVLTYMILTGDRKPLENGVLQTLLKGQEVLISGRTPDWALSYAAMDYLNKAAYLTGDGRWSTYLKRTELDTDIFRLGQSFWPDERIKPALPENLVGKWLINPVFEPVWAQRKNSLKLEQSFQNMSYRSASDASGDFILLDGYNGAYRNPYHTFNILELRLNGTTLLQGYHNQVLTSADGMVEPKVAMDAAILSHGVTGDVASAVAQVPDLPFVNWRRSMALRQGRYVVIADDLGFRSNSDNMLAETTWDMPGAIWMPEYNMVKIQSKDQPKTAYELHTSELMTVRDGRTITMNWRGPGRIGEHKVFFHLLGQNTTGKDNLLASFQLDSNAAALALPEAAIAVTGQYKELKGDMVVLSEKSLYGHALRSAGLGKPLLLANAPIEVDWNFSEGKLAITASQPVTLSLALLEESILNHGKPVKGRSLDGMSIFELGAGEHEFTGAVPSAAIIKNLTTSLPAVLQQARVSRMREVAKNAIALKTSVPVFTPVMQADLGGSPVGSIIIPSKNGNQLGLATGNTITILNPDGREVRKLVTPGKIQVLRWWAEPKLLLAGCADEKVIAFDEQGRKKWEFTSVMDPAVYEAGKPYWFKSAYPGIAGLHSGFFDEGKSRAFVGSACTLEILDENGKLVKRMPVFWGSPRQFLMIDAANGSKNLLLGRWASDRPNLAQVNSKKLEVGGFGYVGVPEGHTFVNGWATMNRYDNFHIDMDGDGKREIVSAINGAWNRVSVYNEDGKPLYNAQFGPGQAAPRSTMRMMDAGDLTGDGKPEIILGVATGTINVLDGQARKLWAKLLPSPPVVVKLVRDAGFNWLCVGSEDGTVMAIDASGNILKQGKVSGRPADLQVIQTPQGQLAVITTDTGKVSGFHLN